MRIIFAALAASLCLGGLAAASDLPVKADVLEQNWNARTVGVNNLIGLERINDMVRPDSSGQLMIDLRDLTTLLDGAQIDPADIYGKVHVGPYPFEADETDYRYRRYRKTVDLEQGVAELPVDYFFGSETNSEDWTDSGQLAVRAELYLSKEGPDRQIGVYDTTVRFRRQGEGYITLPTIVDGPAVGLVKSERPDRVVISFRMTDAVPGAVVLGDGRRFGGDQVAKDFEIEVTGLEPDAEYTYRIDYGDALGEKQSFRTAPKPGEGKFVMAFTSDSRSGAGGGTYRYMGVNYKTLERLAALAYSHGAQVFLMGGDLVDGYTTVKNDFDAQLHAWKQAMNGFMRERPVYPAMGNHETLLNVFMNPDGSDGVALDKWPYDTHSAEAAMARAFVNPANGPEPSDPRRPTYSENVFSFQYGPVLSIAFNNNYWYTNAAARFGGCPEGYLFQDQLDWIQSELERAEADPTIKYIFLYAQEPVFPNGGHVEDAMWYHGNNNIRAHSMIDGELTPEDKGLLDVRNEFVRMIADSSKVAAVLTGDEHGYHRIVIDAETPVGLPAEDDRDEDGVIEWDQEPVSAMDDLVHPTWYITCGGAGAPYYSMEPTPWNVYWKGKKQGDVPGFYYSSQESVVLLGISDEGVAMTVFNPYGEIVDRIDNLMAAKEAAAKKAAPQAEAAEDGEQNDQPDAAAGDDWEE